MREIKFRGKHKDILGQECEWIYGSYLNPRDSCSAHFIADREIPGLTEVIPITVGQFTGLKDKNGTEIYEGDIVKFSWDSSSTLVEFSGIVRFCEKEAAFQFWYDDLKDWSSLAGFESTEMEVIGNIFDNPDLKKHFQEHGWKIKEE